MLAYNRSFNSMKVLALIVILFQFNGMAKEITLYDYKAKKNVDFTKLLESGKKSVLLIDEKCAICEELLANIKVKIKEDFILAATNEPSFKWLAKLSMRYNVSQLFDINSLKLDFSEGTPQLYIFDKNGKLKSRVYGKSNILKTF